ncbi:cytochrome b-c1 complex subunit 2, mitochondrial [Macrobrachium rosenbergii]|uniref:cytochrome b-c1 complex subunit 2, mitochondrial n=1 Tax=Macrobrachium rosenbergii TaxID=79674 RepID=UPI0034D6D475
MASKALKPNSLRTLVKRGYAAQAAAQQSTFALPAQDPKVTTLPSGAVVASLETNAPVSHVAVLFKAGSRYETVASIGASHILRSSVGLGTKNTSSFAITRTIQQAGGSISSESGREHILYGLDIIRDNIDAGLDILGDVSTQHGFKPWELDGNLGRVKDEVAALDPTTVAIELLHKAAFRNSGLGNSIFIPKHRLGKLTSETMAGFVASTHTSNRMAVVGLGIEHDALVSFAKGLGVGSGAGASSSSVFGGGEIRHETGAPVTVVAVAGQGASQGSSDAAALAIAQQILGTGPHIKRGSNASSALAKVVAASGGLGSASALNISYTDSGLFGYFVIADSGSVGQIVGSVHDAVKNLNITDADVARAKNQVKAAVHMATEGSNDALEDMGLQALLTGKYLDPAAAAAAVDGVTAGAVRSALNKVMEGKLSISSVGDVSGVPFLDQL